MSRIEADVSKISSNAFKVLRSFVRNLQKIWDLDNIDTKITSGIPNDLLKFRRKFPQNIEEIYFAEWTIARSAHQAVPENWRSPLRRVFASWSSSGAGRSATERGPLQERKTCAN